MKKKSKETIKNILVLYMNIDTDINNYTIAELAAILHLNEDEITNSSIITEKTNKYISQYNKQNDVDMSFFFQEVQNRLVEYANNTDKEQVEEWYKNEVLEPKDKPLQEAKITERKDQVDVLSKDGKNVMERKQLGVANNYNVGVAQDTLNPNLKNINSRLVNLDSQFRQASGNDTSTDYTLDLSDILKNTLSLRLYSFQIPFSWYTIDDSYKNRCFWISAQIKSVPIYMQPGNYNPSSFVSQLNANFAATGFTFTDVCGNQIPPVKYNNNNAKITISLYGGTYVDPSDNGSTFTIDTTTNLVFFDATAKLQCADTCVPQASLYINQTLGWVMGYRDAIEPVNPAGNMGAAVVDLNGPRYLILAIDDYNQNHINSGLVTITELSTHVKLPNYYSPDLPYICIEGTGLGTGQIEQLVPSAPRTLTNSQIYTINSIIQNNKNNTNYKAKAPTTTDVFAIIPIKQGSTLGSLYVDFSGSLQDNRRTYFGPVNIDRMRIRLLDDKGNLLNLNGSDWSITLIAETLYQY